MNYVMMDVVRQVMSIFESCYSVSMGKICHTFHLSHGAKSTKYKYASNLTPQLKTTCCMIITKGTFVMADAGEGVGCHAGEEKACGGR